MRRARVVVQGALCAGALALSALGCEATIPEGKLSCQTSFDCPEDWHCVRIDPVQLRCFSSPDTHGDAGMDNEGSAGSGQVMPVTGDAAMPAIAGSSGGGEAGSAGSAGAGGTAGSGGSPASSTPGIAVLGEPCSEDRERACAGHDSLQPLVCNDDGEWEAASLCDSGERCDSRPSSLTLGTCRLIVTDCADHEPLRPFCVGAFAISGAACPGLCLGTCDANCNHTDGDAGVCDGACDGLCFGTCVTSPAGIRTCDHDRVSAVTSTCPGDQVCVNSLGGPYCACPDGSSATGLDLCIGGVDAGI